MHQHGKHLPTKRMTIENPHFQNVSGGSTSLKPTSTSSKHVKTLTQSCKSFFRPPEERQRGSQSRQD